MLLKWQSANKKVYFSYSSNPFIEAVFNLSRKSMYTIEDRSFSISKRVQR